MTDVLRSSRLSCCWGSDRNAIFSGSCINPSLAPSGKMTLIYPGVCDAGSSPDCRYGTTVNLGRVDLSYDGTGSADGITPRVFGGVQANILMFKLYGQLNVGFNDTFGGHTGLRVVL